MKTRRTTTAHSPLAILIVLAVFNLLLHPLFAAPILAPDEQLSLADANQLKSARGMIDAAVSGVRTATNSSSGSSGRPGAVVGGVISAVADANKVNSGRPGAVVGGVINAAVEASKNGEGKAGTSGGGGGNIKVGPEGTRVGGGASNGNSDKPGGPSMIKVGPDGSRVEIRPDGSKVEVAGQGKTGGPPMVKVGPDGSRVEIGAGGSKVVGDGGKADRPPMVKVGPDGTRVEIRPDGSKVEVAADGNGQGKSGRPPTVKVGPNGTKVEIGGSAQGKAPKPPVAKPGNDQDRPVDVNGGPSKARPKPDDEKATGGGTPAKAKPKPDTGASGATKERPGEGGVKTGGDPPSKAAAQNDGNGGTPAKAKPKPDTGAPGGTKERPGEGGVKTGEDPPKKSGAQKAGQGGYINRPGEESNDGGKVKVKVKPDPDNKGRPSVDVAAEKGKQPAGGASKGKGNGSDHPVDPSTKSKAGEHPNAKGQAPVEVANDDKKVSSKNGAKGSGGNVDASGQTKDRPPHDEPVKVASGGQKQGAGGSKTKEHANAKGQAVEELSSEEKHALKQGAATGKKIQYTPDSVHGYILHPKPPKKPQPKPYNYAEAIKGGNPSYKQASSYSSGSLHGYGNWYEQKKPVTGGSRFSSASSWFGFKKFGKASGSAVRPVAKKVVGVIP